MVHNFMLVSLKDEDYFVESKLYCGHFLWDLNNTKWCNGFYTEFRQHLAKETFSYDEHLKS